jgi:hypothetical protein
MTAAASRSQLAVCSTYRDGAEYLPEWIEFHRLVGVERFFLYDNGSTGNHLEVLAPYLEEGIVVVHDWPGVARQHAAYDDCLERHRDDAAWIAFFDVDEFLFTPSGKPVTERLREFEPYPAVGVNQAVFGTSGHVARPDGLVIENYLYRRQAHARWIKSIVQPARTVRNIGAHSFEYEGGAQAVDVLKRPLEGHLTESTTLRGLRINHYYTKSLEEYRTKRATPRPDTGELREPIDFDRMVEFERRYVRDEKILIYLDDLKQALGEYEERLAAGSSRG